MRSNICLTTETEGLEPRREQAQLDRTKSAIDSQGGLEPAGVLRRMRCKAPTGAKTRGRKTTAREARLALDNTKSAA